MKLMLDVDSVYLLPPDVPSNHLRSLASGGEIELSPETLKASIITSYFTYLMQAHSQASCGRKEAQTELVKTIQDCGAYLMSIINCVLDFAKLETDDMIDVEPRDAFWWVMAKDGALKQSLINGSYKNKTLLLKRKKNLVKLIYNFII
ncbi:1730_t:CDS:2 [Rhizophagus irregularis]|nr:1730_t:CDS:2 [Rhizophagus irregularis]